MKLKLRSFLLYVMQIRDLLAIAKFLVRTVQI